MTKLTGVRTAELVNPMGGGNNPDGDMHGENCASCKFHFGDSPTGRKPQKDGDEPKDQSDA
ncbi:hypothetical protein Bca4012_006125 [Brassica carinata]